MYKGKKVR